MISNKLIKCIAIYNSMCYDYINKIIIAQNKGEINMNNNQPEIYYVFDLRLKDTLINNNFLPIVDSVSAKNGTCYKNDKAYWRFHMDEKLHKFITSLKEN